MRANKVEIRCDKFDNVDVYINDIKLEGLKRVEFNASAGKVPSLLIEMNIVGESHGYQR